MKPFQDDGSDALLEGVSEVSEHERRRAKVHHRVEVVTDHLNSIVLWSGSSQMFSSKRHVESPMERMDRKT